MSEQDSKAESTIYSMYEERSVYQENSEFDEIYLQKATLFSLMDEKEENN